jgi:hypothetical protein
MEDQKKETLKQENAVIDTTPPGILGDEEQRAKVETIDNNKTVTHKEEKRPGLFGIFR